MNKLFLLIGTVIISFHLYGQNSSVIDSLLTNLESADEDTIKVEMLLRLFNPTVVNDLDLAYEYTDQAHRLSKSCHSTKGLRLLFKERESSGVIVEMWKKHEKTTLKPSKFTTESIMN